MKAIKEFAKIGPSESFYQVYQLEVTKSLKIY